MRRSLRRWTILALFPVAIFLIALASHPYFSVTDPSGAHVAVVEGWMPAGLLPVVKEEIEKRGYERIYTTGTTRPFAYWLKEHEAIEVVLPEPMEGGIRIVAAGLPGAQLLVLADGDTMMIREVTGSITAYWMQPTRAVRKLWLGTFRSNAPDGADVIFLKDLDIRGNGVHGLKASITLHKGDGSAEPGWPTYADLAAKRLRDHGPVDLEIIPVPAITTDLGRTWGNAQAFAERAKKDGITAVDVISMGVHARRSRKVFQKAAGDAITIGVISLPDPKAPPEKWWRTRIGWIRLLKEMVASPMTDFRSEDGSDP